MHNGPPKNVVSCASYWDENGNLANFEAVEKNGTAFEPMQCLYQNVAEGMENPKRESHSRCNKRIGRYDPPKNEVSCASYWAENGNLVKFGVVNNGTAFAPNQC